jgi:threonine synthase
MAYILSQLFSQKINRIVIPSSGNAGISACTFGKLKENVEIVVFGAKDTKKEKIDKIESLGFKVILSDRPIYDSIRFAKENDYYFLRPSLEINASEGFKTIAYELDNENGKIDDIFIPVSSGVCFMGIYLGFQELGYFPKLHLCQSSSINPVASLYDNDFSPSDTSLSDALVSKKAPLKEKLINAIKNTNGTGWVIDDNGIKNANNFLKDKNIITSFEGALAYASIIKARNKGFVLGKTVCLLTGKKYG